MYRAMENPTNDRGDCGAFDVQCDIVTDIPIAIIFFIFLLRLFSSLFDIWFNSLALCKCLGSFSASDCTQCWRTGKRHLEQ
jgi:hypothetical protein